MANGLNPNNYSYNKYPYGQPQNNFGEGPIRKGIMSVKDGNSQEQEQKTAFQQAFAPALTMLELEGTSKEIPHVIAGMLTCLGLAKATELLSYSKKTAVNKTAADAFQDSLLVKYGNKIDKKIGKTSNAVLKPVIAIKDGILKLIPNSVKKGAQPVWPMAKSMSNGLSYQAAEFLTSAIENLPTHKLQELGLKDILRQLKAHKLDPKQAAEAIIKTIDDKTIQQLTVELPKGSWERLLTPWSKTKKINLAKKANIYKIFKGHGSKNPVIARLQSLLAGASDGASGKILGGTIGLVMSGFFMASAFKKAMNAPKGEKISTFMESFWGDFVGGFLVMFPAATATYKLAGLSNIGRGQAASTIERKTKNIKWLKNYTKNADKIIKSIEKLPAQKVNNRTITKLRAKGISEEIINQLKTKGYTSDVLKAMKEKGFDDKIISKLKQISIPTEIKNTINQTSGLMQKGLGISKDFSNLSRDEAVKYLNKLKQKATPEKINSIIDELDNLKKATKLKLPFNPLKWRLKNNPLAWAVKKAGDIIAVGLHNTPSKIGGSIFKRTKNIFKGGSGAVIRFALVLALTEPLRKLCIKGSHLVFGRPTKSILDEETEEEETKANATKAPTPQVSMDDFLKYTHKTSETANKPAASQSIAIPQQAQPQAAASLKRNNGEELESDPNRKYIPSPIATNFERKSNDKVNQEIENSYKWEQEAQRVLSEQN